MEGEGEYSKPQHFYDGRFFLMSSSSNFLSFFLNISSFFASLFRRVDDSSDSDEGDRIASDATQSNRPAPQPIAT